MKQRKNAVLIFAVVIVMIGVSIVLAEQFAGTGASTPPPHEPVVGTRATAVAATPAVAITATAMPEAVISKEEATALLDEGETHGYSIAGITLTDRYPGKLLYEFSLVPDSTHSRKTNATLFIDAETGDPYAPLQDKAGITIEQAKEKARGAFPNIPADRVRIRFNDGSQYMRGWSFDLMNAGDRLVQGGLDADTGELKSYFIGIKRLGRPATPSVPMDAAQRTAEREVRERNGELPLTLVDARLDPLGMPGEDIAGKYVFVYKRVIHGIPCASDGIVVTVDSVAGNVVEYGKSWILPEDAVALPAEPVISKDTATATVKKEAEKIYPASADGLRIISAELRWRDFHNPDKVTPGPGSVPLAWEVQFDDETIRAQQYPSLGNGWIDARNGTLLDLYYRHEH